MNLTPCAAEEDFRARVRAWLRANLPDAPRPHEGVAQADFDRAWQRRQFDGGWAGINWPTAVGGRGLSLAEQLIWHEEYALAGAPHAGVNFIGLSQVGPTLIACGSAAQRAAWLPAILRGEAIWCQGFSEPDAGSDLAALRTRGRVDGDHLVISGQKTWTSYAHLADYQELLVRTDAASTRHHGLSWVICAMNSPGITVRPMRTMSGRLHFCEVFYDDVRVPLANVVGGLDNGWQVAMSTLGWERGTAFIAEQIELERGVETLIATASSTLGPDGVRCALDHEDLAEQLAGLRAEVRALRAMTLAGVSRVARSGVPGAEASIVRLYFSELTQKLRRLALRIAGPAALDPGSGADGAGWSYVDGFRYTIAAGTAEIQRNIIGERLLGLPRQR